MHSTLSFNPKVVVFVILLMTLNQFAITIYLPSIPHMVQSLHTTYSTVQMTITLYVIGYGISGFIYGPLSDFYGRRIILLVGLSIFLLGSLAASFTQSIGILLCARFLQGLGNECGDVIGRAVLCDIYDS